jgi:hypothetical protein
VKKETWLVFKVSLWSFAAGLVIHLFSGLFYVSSFVGERDPLLMLMLTVYILSGNLVLHGFLYFAVAVPLMAGLFHYWTPADPAMYPLSGSGIGLAVALVAAFLVKTVDWHSMMLWVSAGFVFGCLWWNRLYAAGERQYAT